MTISPNKPTSRFTPRKRSRARQADRIAGSLERIREAADQLSFGLDPETSPHQLQRITLAVECLEAELTLLADQTF